MSASPRSAADRVIVALDRPGVEDAERVVAALGDQGRFFKIGYQLFPLGGYDLARRLSDAGKKVFIDAKLHDIGATVARGAASVARLGADFLTVHAERDSIKGALAGRADDPRLKILAVTVLTSLDEDALRDSGIDIPLSDLVLRRAALAAEEGADGVIASPREARALRDRFGDALLIVTPGVRPEGGARDDQKRVATPREAVRNGADFLVIGRPVVDADDPKAALDAITASLEA